MEFDTVIQNLFGTVSEGAMRDFFDLLGNGENRDQLKTFLKTLQESEDHSSEDLWQMREAREQFFRDGTIADSVRPEVAASWKRCRERGMPRSGASVPEKLTGKAFRDMLMRQAYFIRTATPIIRDTMENALDKEELPLAMYITDAEGTILHVECSNEVTHMAVTYLGMEVGARWNEENIGTNSVSIAIETGGNYRTTAYEHYYEEHSLINCISALMHDNDGNLIGTLTISYLRNYYNPLLTSFVTTAAHLIETSMMLTRDRGAMNYVMNNADEGVLILDGAGFPLQANAKLYQMIGVKDPDQAELDITRMLQDVDWSYLMTCGKLHTSVGETFLNYHDICRRVKVDIYLIDLYGKRDGYVVILHDIADIISQSQQYTSNTTVFRFDSIITEDPEMKHLIAECKQIASRNCAVLIEGESGTGKELFAESIHNYSDRSAGPFVAVNCAALPPSLVESELFGYEKGTFTDGLNTGKAGKFEQANGGTIFLDEVGELSLDIQAKLLRVLDNNRITRIGGKTEKKLDLRVIAATNRDLYDMIQEKNFREDLYYRLCVFSVVLPPLNQREGDIPLLIHHFLRRLRIENRGVTKEMSDASMEMLCNHHWNGNVRELQNAVSRAYYLCDTSVIGPQYLPRTIRDGQPAEKPKLPDSMKNHERDLILSALMNNNWNVSRAAKQLNISRATIHRKMRSLGINH